MDTRNDTGHLSVTVAGAYFKGAILALDVATGKSVLADDTTAAHLVQGHLTEQSSADGDGRTVRLLKSTPGTHYGLSAVAIALGDELRIAAGGKITNVGGGQLIGAALQARGADEYVEYMPRQV